LDTKADLHLNIEIITLAHHEHEHISQHATQTPNF